MKSQPPLKTTVRRLVLRPTAEADVAELYHYIAERSGNPQTAIQYIRRLRAWCENLLTFPESGRRRDDLRPDVRIIGFERRLVIAYKVLSCGDVEIGRIFYGGRNYEALVSEENDP